MQKKGNFNRKNFYKKGKKEKTNSNQSAQITFFLIDRHSIGADVPFQIPAQIRNFIKKQGSASWNQQGKYWNIKRENYALLIQKVEQKVFQVNNQKGSNDRFIKVNPIEDFILRAQNMLMSQELKTIEITTTKPFSSIKLQYNTVEKLIDPETFPLFQKLFGFQKQSLKFGIAKHGRMLLADEMGVGKTVQSLAVAYIYKHQWPLLIICPPTLKFNWLNQIKRWYPSIQSHQIQMINNAKTVLKVNVQIIIISYDLAWRMKEMFNQIKIAIADEAHYLKNSDCKRSDILVPFLSARKRVILLTGTPAFARPREIFNLIQIVRPGLFKNFKMFGNRYCEPKWNPWSHTYDYNGCKNVKQLHYLLKGNIMLRRLKAQVLTELPDKCRQKVTLNADNQLTRQIKKLLDDNNVTQMQTFFAEMIQQTSLNSQENKVDKRQEVMQAYRLSGKAKIKAVKQYISDILENDIKILIFAHHREIMDQIQIQLKQKKKKFMRIDGSVNQSVRQDSVQQFQTDPSVLVALLSITAAGVGITLTAASTVIFAELHWTPALMIQAEDRAHRVGQKNSVNCHYLIGEGTLDEILYNFLEKKVLNVSSFVDGESKRLQIQSVKKGEKGKISKRQSLIPKLQERKRKSIVEQLMPQFKNSPSSSKSKKEQFSQQSNFTDISMDGTLNVKRSKESKKPRSLNTLDNFMNRKKSPMPQLKEIQKEVQTERQSCVKDVKIENQNQEYYDSQDSDELFEKALNLYKQREKKLSDSQKTQSQQNEKEQTLVEFKFEKKSEEEQICQTQSLASNSKKKSVEIEDGLQYNQVEI